jgi:7-carboxy-7-deazaguanine synthase
MPDHIMVSEIFGPTIQGEGALAGKLSHFLRTFGCSYRCTWCDSMHAVDPANSGKARRLTAVEIVKELSKLPPAPWLTVTGGDPVDWDLATIIIELRLFQKIAVETQGAVWRDWLEYCHLVTVSPKGPSSWMEKRFNPAVLQKYHVRLRDRMVLKIVCFDDADLDFAERIHRFMPDVPLYLSAGTTVAHAYPAGAVLQRYKWLAESMIKRPKLMDCICLPQLHVLVWGQEIGH